MSMFFKKRKTSEVMCPSRESGSSIQRPLQRFGYFSTPVSRAAGSSEDQAKEDQPTTSGNDGGYASSSTKGKSLQTTYRRTPSLITQEDDKGSESESRKRRVAPKLQFKAPPTFSGAPHEDIVEWVDRYERIGKFNQWEDEDLASNVCMYLEGAARKWALCIGNLPDFWEDFGELPGIKTTLLVHFKSAQYELMIEIKLRLRVQGPDEPAIEYFFDVLNLCRLIDEDMEEATIIDHLFRGFRPELIKVIYPSGVQDCDEFLNALKVHEEA